jgi:serine/threonine-protein kinase
MIGYTVGSYKITEKIGEGGMGSVFKGIDMMLEREVAIKVLRPELSRQPNLVERFRSEAVTLARLNHPNIATLYSFIRQGDDFFMVMEYVRGETLESLIRRSGRLACEPAVALFCQALEGIEHAHRFGVIHRDIKPANLMLTDEGTVKVMDFGIARALGTGRITKTGHLIGTIEYMSPEQVRGQETDTRSDIYSLGILLYEMLTGRVPFTSTSEYELMRAQIEGAPPPPSTFVVELPLPVEQAIMRALAKKTEARFHTAGEFRAVLLPALGEAAHYRANAAPAPDSHIANWRPKVEIKETRMPDNAGHADFSSGYPIPGTRLSPSGGMELAGALSQMVRGLTARLNRLTWKHYAGAAALLIIVLSMPLVFRGDKNPAPQPVTGTTTKPSTSVQPEAAPVAAPPIEQPVDSPAILPPGEQVAADPARDPARTKPSAARTPRNPVNRGGGGKPVAAAAPASESGSKASESGREERRSARDEEKRRSARDEEKRRSEHDESESKPEKKKSWWKKASEVVKGAGDVVDGIRKIKKP